MKAFHGKKETKDFYINRVDEHIRLDNLVRGEGWNGTKGCAVGCTLEDYNHASYETELGIPEWLARVEDRLFEGMSEEKSRTWPKVFLETIKVGVDLEKTKTPFIIKILERNLRSMDAVKFDEKKFPDVAKAIEGSKLATLEMIKCHRENLDLTAARSAAESARSAAESAWSAAESAWSAAESARSAAGSARSAAWSAAESARSAARSAWSAAESARSAAGSARSAAWSAAYDEMADELLEILKDCV